MNGVHIKVLLLLFPFDTGIRFFTSTGGICSSCSLGCCCSDLVVGGVLTVLVGSPFGHISESRKYRPQRPTLRYSFSRTLRLYQIRDVGVGNETVYGCGPNSQFFLSSADRLLSTAVSYLAEEPGVTPP